MSSTHLTNPPTTPVNLFRGATLTSEGLGLIPIKFHQLPPPTPQARISRVTRSWPSAERDLRWYFSGANLSGPIQSSFSRMVKRMKGVRASPPTEPDRLGGVLDDRRRAHRIERVLTSLDGESRSTLEVAFGEPPPVELKPYGNVATLVLGSPLAFVEHRLAMAEDDLLHWLRDLPGRARREPAAQVTFDHLRSDARQRLHEALAAFVEMRRRMGS